jgi:hypothetical protein
MKAAFVVCYDHCQATVFSEHDASADCDSTAPNIIETPCFRRNDDMASRWTRRAAQGVERYPLNAADEPRSQYPPAGPIRGRTSPPCDAGDALPGPVATVVKVGVVARDERCDRYGCEHDEHGPGDPDVGPVERSGLVWWVHVVRLQRLYP